LTINKLSGTIKPMDIRGTILDLLVKQPKVTTGDVQATLSKSVSRQAVNLVVNQLIDEGLLIKSGSTRGAFYTSPQGRLAENMIKKRLRNDGLEEHIIFEELRQQAPFIRILPDNVQSILAYAFSEMLNNAIEHSCSKYIEVGVADDAHLLSFSVKDSGVGVFRNVMKKRGLKSELEAIQDLLKGKTTTRPKAHSGEGIFFTSKVADVFLLDSFDYRLRVENTPPDVFVEKLHGSERGTKVTFAIAKNSKRHLSDIFKQYQTSSETLAFDKTEVHIKLYTMGTIYISRSQARRVLVGLNKFRSVVLDFDKVPTIGQAFADEIFRVFKQDHSEIQLIPVNMNDAVAFMVGRVRVD